MVTNINPEMYEELRENESAPEGKFNILIEKVSEAEDKNGVSFTLMEATVQGGQFDGKQANESFYIYPKEVYDYDNTARIKTKMAINKLSQIGEIFNDVIYNLPADLKKYEGKVIGVERSKTEKGEGSSKKTYYNNKKYFKADLDIPM